MHATPTQTIIKCNNEDDWSILDEEITTGFRFIFVTEDFVTVLADEEFPIVYVHWSLTYELPTVPVDHTIRTVAVPIVLNRITPFATPFRVGQISTGAFTASLLTVAFAAAHLVRLPRSDVSISDFPL